MKERAFDRFNPPTGAIVNDPFVTEVTVRGTEIPAAEVSVTNTIEFAFAYALLITADVCPAEIEAEPDGPMSDRPPVNFAAVPPVAVVVAVKAVVADD